MGSTSKPTESATYHEICTQTVAWQQAIQVAQDQAGDLNALWSQGDYDRVLFTGCGSTYYLALAAAALFQSWMEVPARGVPAGELVMYPETAYAAGRTLLVAVSRSAETTETVRATEAFRKERQGEVIVVTNYGSRPLSKLGTATLAIPAGQEESIAQTRSFASMFVAITALTATLAGRQGLLDAMRALPERGDKLIQAYEPLARQLGGDMDLDRFYFLGSGPRYGLACEVNLKMKEMSLTHSEPFHFLEFRHGPKSMAGPSALVIGLLAEACRAYETAVLHDVKELGARVLCLAERPLAEKGVYNVTFDAQLPPEVDNVLYLPVLQLMAYYRSLAKGLNPDRPHNLDAVVKLA
jgi:glucosamine--fructose-6-phosphate aminotransferase (isomerizing)